jgi:hypothetical protein
MLLPFEAEASSVFDLKTGRMVLLNEKNVTKGRRSEHSVTFDYTSRIATYATAGGTEKSRELPIPLGDPTDLMMGLLQTRTWDLKPGQKRDALVLFDDDFYELTMHMARYEDVVTPVGKFRTIVLEPRMDKTPPKGMFKRGSRVRIWIAQDDHRLPGNLERKVIARPRDVGLAAGAHPHLREQTLLLEPEHRGRGVQRRRQGPRLRHGSQGRRQVGVREAGFDRDLRRRAPAGGGLL